MRKIGGKSNRPLVAALVAVIIVLPLVIVQLIPTDAPMEHVFQAAVQEELGRSSDSKLVYYSVDALQGSYPANDLVIAIDRAYTRGAAPEDIQTGGTYWFQGSIMTPEVFYGEQYLFFDRPQVYTRQVKAGIMWPDQWNGLRELYLSPVTALAAPIQLPLLVRSEEMSALSMAVLLARLALIILLVVLVVRRLRRKQDILVPLLLYAVAAILVTVPILTDLY
ncbi:MAG: hypothetical protein ACOC7M_00435 [Chloroflexota bacterium]